MDLEHQNTKETLLDPEKATHPAPPFGRRRRRRHRIPFCQECSSPPSMQVVDAFKFNDGKEASFGLLPSASFSWRENLLKVSNFASLLCVLDCTVLPLVTVILPLFGAVTSSTEFLQDLGHEMAFFFVIPVGGLATTLNYTNHRKMWIATLGYLGLLGILAASAGCESPKGIPGPIGKFVHGWLHRVANVTGCTLLLFSNFMSRRQKGCCTDPSCAHTR